MTIVDLGPVPDGSTTLSGYLARPDGPGPWPGVVAIHEVWGLDDVIRRHADRLARAGYLTLAPDLFSDGGPRRCIVSTFRALRRGQGHPLHDIEAARTYLARHPDCTGKVGVIGFCMGGGFALLVANRGFDVAADNYGILPRDLPAAVTGACPIVASYGGRGPERASARTVPKLVAALEEAGVPHDVKRYPEAGHSFLNDIAVGPKLLQPLLKVTRTGPEPASAADAWTRIEAFFGTYLRDTTR
ncbi:dienelactone hydrolase family protein [Candidatus Protofrankia californiensis]|uniref:dienelactone hydrolase family protein n=1 Tax=Candidatus Protofrankia californiensis TaxID=1839754 RepID=UPI001F49D90C|nr:dienelactone hydrolase family protein [Candidatus Protofrankia californiensis]